jgi:hypothetical protein
LNLHRVKDIRQTEIHTAEHLVPDPSPFDHDIVTAKLQKYKSPGSDKIRAQLIQAGGEILGPKIHKLINTIWNKEELLDQLKENIIVHVHKKGEKTNRNISRGMSMLPS